MNTTFSIALVITGLLLACSEPKAPLDANTDASGNADASADANADASGNTDASADANARSPDGAITADAGADANLPPTVTCPMVRQVPFPEVCNAFDDDCDGLLDEGTCDDPCDQPW